MARSIIVKLRYHVAGHEPGTVVKTDYGVGRTMVDYGRASEMPAGSQYEHDMTSDPKPKMVRGSGVRNKAFVTQES